MTAASPRRARSSPALVLACMLVAFVGAAQARGVVSSNDGSHLALARALWLRRTVELGPDCALTLGIDVAVRDGQCLSDRPPGTAWLAGPAVRLGEALSASALAWSRARERPSPWPAGAAFIATHGARAPAGFPLARLIGAAVGVSLHGVLLLLVGLGAVSRAAMRHASAPSRALMIVVFGTATAWATYATTLFAHATAAMCVALVLLAVERLARGSEGTGDVGAAWVGGARGPRSAGGAQRAVGARGASRSSLSSLGRGLYAALMGLALGLGVATEYALAPSALLAALLLARPRDWPFVIMGASLPIAALLAYHNAAFGSPWSIGYDHQAHFDFARSRGGMLSGDLIVGLWRQWGLGSPGSLLLSAPVAVLGTAGAVAWWLSGSSRGGSLSGAAGDALGAGAAPGSTSTTEDARSVVPASAFDGCFGIGPRVVLVVLPYVVIAALQPDPGGGEGADHRYLIPLLPLAAWGAAVSLERWIVTPLSRSGSPDRRAWLLTVIAVLATITSGVASWRGFWAWTQSLAFPEIWLGGVAAACALGACLAIRPLSEASPRDEGV